MIVREWKDICPKEHGKEFLEHLYVTGVKDTSRTKGFLGAQILNRDLGSEVETTLLTYWQTILSNQFKCTSRTA